MYVGRAPYTWSGSLVEGSNQPLVHLMVGTHHPCSSAFVQCLAREGGETGRQSAEEGGANEEPQAGPGHLHTMCVGDDLGVRRWVVGFPLGLLS